MYFSSCDQKCREALWETQLIYFSKVRAFPRMEGICTDESIHYKDKALDSYY